MNRINHSIDAASTYNNNSFFVTHGKLSRVQTEQSGLTYNNMQNILALLEAQLEQHDYVQQECEPTACSYIQRSDSAVSAMAEIHHVEKHSVEGEGQ